MATTLALRFLPFFLFFFMNGHGIAARDLKVELRDEKEVDRDEPYVARYSTTPDSIQPNYRASYTFRKHNRPSHHGILNEPYKTGYITTPDSTRPKYISSYTFMKHNHPSHRGNRLHEANQPSYLIRYGTNTHDSNKAYITAYQTPFTHDSNQYAFDAKEDPKESVHDTNEPYITQYGGSEPNKDTKESATTNDSTKPYVTSHGLRPKKDSKESTAQDSDEPYITQYGNIGPKNDPKESAQDHNKPYIIQYGNHDPKQDPKESTPEPYIIQYGNHDPKQDPKESTQDYAATYKKKLEESKGMPSSNLDHTEAFKTGFFTLDDLYIGKIMTLQFPVQQFSHFLSRKEADAIPFSTSQLSSVLQLFSISEDSPQAKSMRDTLEQCEAGTITGETKTCANSLESMVEFVGTIIGSEAKYDILTTSHATPSGAPMQKYTISKVSQDIYAPKWVACHPLPYPYAVYYCHFIATGSKVFKVSLSGENGDKMEALGICHLDTSDWSPNHILFRQLGIKPGEAPVCHFFPVKHLMWVPQPSTATM